MIPPRKRQKLYSAIELKYLVGIKPGTLANLVMNGCPTAGKRKGHGKPSNLYNANHVYLWLRDTGHLPENQEGLCILAGWKYTPEEIKDREAFNVLMEGWAAGTNTQEFKKLEAEWNKKIEKLANEPLPTLANSTSRQR